MTKEQSKVTDFLWNTNKYNTIQLIAGAGSGKTTTLIQTVKNCIKVYSNPEKICLITFSKKAANEMQERLGTDTKSIGFVGTMHSLAYKLIKETYNRPINIITDHFHIYKEIVQNKFNDLSYIPLEFLFYGEANHQERVQLLHQEYKKYKKERGLYDFEDLIIEATNMCQERIISKPYNVVFVDEFQDTSPMQLKFIKSLNADRLFVVGDDWQSIYKFRGADVSITLQFQKHFERSKRLFLTKNFRSQKNIVRLGNIMIKNLSKEFVSKKLIPHYGSGKKPICHVLPDNKDIKYYSNRIIEWNLGQSPDRQLVILVRTNYMKELISKYVPHHFEVFTIHSVKGLEFDHVLIFGIANNMIPHRWGDFDEEVRLFYVGITRAKKTIQFLAWEKENRYSKFLPLLARKCSLNYL